MLTLLKIAGLTIIVIIVKTIFGTRNRITIYIRIILSIKTTEFGIKLKTKGPLTIQLARVSDTDTGTTTFTFPTFSLA